MSNDIRKSEKPGNIAYLNVGVWYDAETGHIHMTLQHSGWFHTTVNAEATSERRHPDLFGKLARALKEAGVLAPVVVETD